MTDESRFAFNRPTAEARTRRLAHALSSVPPGAAVLDVGAGQMPYRALIETDERTYTSVDVEGDADVIGRAEKLPFDDGSFDLVVCFQVLEHVDRPEQAVAEFARVLRPGGRVLLSTHGVFVYHPHPRDLWRWTAEGLDELFRRHDFESTVHGLAGSAATIGILVSFYLDHAAARRPRLASIRRLIPLIHRVGESLDRRFPELADPWAPSTLFCNYFVDARKQS